MRLTSVVKHMFFVALALCWLPKGAAAEVSCTSSVNNKNIGLEFVSTSCQTDTASTRVYIDTAIQCSGSQVSLFAHYGDTQTTPGGLVGSLLSQGYRVFGDQYGNHIIAVHSIFGGSSFDTIDGKQMSTYTPGSFIANVFDKILYPQAVDNDADNDHYLNCDDCNDADPLVNPGAAENCSDKKDNNCDGAQDCDDQDCAAQQACQGGTEDVVPTEHPRDCHLNVSTSTD